MSRTGLWRLCVSLALSFVLLQSTLAAPPQTAASSQQAVILLQKSLAALVGNVSLSDVTLTGSVRRTAGSDDETGTVTYRAFSGSSRLELNLSSGSWLETRYPGSDGPVGAWSGPDGVQHAAANHNVMADSGLFPFFAIGSLNLGVNSIITYIGPETRNGISVIHLTASQQFPTLSSRSRNLLQHLTEVEVYVDASTLLPASYVYNIHPDNDAGLDIPTEVRYSNYQSISGAQIPLHIEKFVNNSLLLDLQFQNASLNTGITVAQITAQ